MARAPDERVIKAKELYESGLKLVEIASQLNVPEGTIRSWKNRNKWESNAKQQKSATLQNKNETKQNHIPEEIIALEKSNLTDRQKLFCIEYIKCFNATKAATKAGYSKVSAYSLGYQQLQKPSVQKEIQRLKQAKLNRAMLSGEDIFQRMIDIAFADIVDYLSFGQEDIPLMGDNGPIKSIDPDTGEEIALTKKINVLRVNESDMVDGSLISEVSQGRDGFKIKLHDKIRAIQWLADRMDLLPTESVQKLELEREKVKFMKQKMDNENEEDTALKIQIVRAQKRE